MKEIFLRLKSKIEIFELRNQWVKVSEFYNSWTTAGKDFWKDVMLASVSGIDGVYVYDGSTYYYNNTCSRTYFGSNLYFYGYFRFNYPEATLTSCGLYFYNDSSYTYTYLTSASFSYTNSAPLDMCVRYTLNFSAPNSKTESDVINRLLELGGNQWNPDTFKLYWSGGSGTTGVTKQGGSGNGIVNYRTTDMISTVAGTNTVTEIRLYDSSEGDSNYYASFTGSWSGDVYFYVKYTTTFS